MGGDGVGSIIIGGSGWLSKQSPIFLLQVYIFKSDSPKDSSKEF